MKKLRSRMLLVLLAVNLVAFVLAEMLAWVLAPVLFGEAGDQNTIATFTFGLQTALSLIIFAIFVVMGINELIRPIEVLSQAAQQVADGDYDIEIAPTRRRDEIGGLSHSFSAMVKELKSTEYMQRDFAANVSHEFRTPLAVISGYAELLTQPTLNDAERIQCGQAVAEEAQRLNSMTTNILLLAKLNNQGLRPAYAPFALDEQLRQTVLLLEKRWRDKKISFQLAVPALTLRGNEELLALVWLNLLDNAIKYSGQEGVIEIQGRLVGAAVGIQIRDYGIGMDAATQASMFEQFYQGDTSHQAMGSGLGLALVKRIVELHQGNISVTSKLGVGTTITVNLSLGL